MKKTLGIIGGGQLGMMLTEAAKKMSEQISDVIVLDPTENCPASQSGAKQIVGDFKDENSIVKLATDSDIITYEIESGNSDVLKSVEDKAVINPSPETLRIIQDKLLQKTFLRENNLPVADFIKIETLDELKTGIEKLGIPSLLKSRRDAYDGRGNYKINSRDEIETAFNHFKGRKLMLEKFVDFKMEVSVIAARNTNGDISTYPVVENIHEDNILRMTIAPARVSSNIAKNAEQIAHDTMQVLHGAGVFGIEMFVSQKDEILINEIAPRVHNSGHHTLNSSRTSQFEQHLRAILGMELGSTELLHPTVMYNILGPKEFSGTYKPVSIQEKNVFVKMYGKKESKPKRKIGHVNIVAEDSQSIDDLIKRVESIRHKLTVEPT